MRRVFKIAIVVLVILAAGVLLVLLFPASEYQPPQRDIRDGSAYHLDEKLGWYRLEDGSYKLIAAGPENGLVMYRFGSAWEDLDRLSFGLAAICATLAHSWVKRKLPKSSRRPRH
jgi:hypothetical protein